MKPSASLISVLGILSSSHWEGSLLKIMAMSSPFLISTWRSPQSHRSSQMSGFWPSPFFCFGFFFYVFCSEVWDSSVTCLMCVIVWRLILSPWLFVLNDTPTVPAQPSLKGNCRFLRGNVLEIVLFKRKTGGWRGAFVSCRIDRITARTAVAAPTWILSKQSAILRDEQLPGAPS